MFVALSNAMQKHTAILNSRGEQFDSCALIANIRGKLAPGAASLLNWNLLGQALGTPFIREPPRIEFMCGPFSVEHVVKEAAPRKKRVAEPELEKEQRPEEVTERMEKTADPQAKRCKEMGKVVQSRPKKSDLFSLVINQKSFSQTVENVFDFSFLLKAGAVGLKVNDDGLPVVTATDVSLSDGNADNDKMKTTVISLSMRDIEQIQAAYEMNEESQELKTRIYDSAGDDVRQRGQVDPGDEPEPEGEASPAPKPACKSKGKGPASKKSRVV